MDLNQERLLKSPVSRAKKLKRLRLPAPKIASLGPNQFKEDRCFDSSGSDDEVEDDQVFCGMPSFVDTSSRFYNKIKEKAL